LLQRPVTRLVASDHPLPPEENELS
jgi:hypothetical protein